MKMELKSAKGVEIHINVHVTREYRVRMWLAMQLFRLAGWVSGADIVVHNPPSKSPPTPTS